MPDGKVIKGVGGLYTVFADDGRLYECRAKGIFRKQGIKVIIGDNVSVDIIDEAAGEGIISDVVKRKNRLIRPELANIDCALIVAALKSPEPDFITVDKLILSFKKQDIPVIICFNKEDIADDALVETIADAYDKSGCKTVITSTVSNKGIDELKSLLSGRLTGIAGVSGVGKSSIINALQKNVSLETGDISKKLKRGRHTTRHSEIIPIDENTFIADTPGFSSFDAIGIRPEELAGFYDEFDKYNTCYFKPCSHTHEPDCAVKDAVNASLISRRRYDNYVHIYDELKKIPQYGRLP